MTEHFAKTWHGYCPEFDEERDICIETFVVTTLSESQTFGFSRSHCPEQDGCGYVDHRGFCPFVKGVLDRLASS